MIDFQNPDPPADTIINEALTDFGLYHSIDTAIRMYAEYKNHGRYWYEGAGVDQPDAYWRDIGTLNWLYLYVKHVLPKAQDLAKLDSTDVITRLRNGGTL